MDKLQSIRSLEEFEDALGKISKEDEDLNWIEEVLDLLKVGSVPERNEPCYCDSGKKYKKCCEKQLQKKDALFNELKFSDDPSILLDAEGETLSIEDEQKFWDYLVCKDSKDLAKNLKNLAQKYDNPYVWEMLAYAYSSIDNSEVFDFNLILKKFPDCLFSKVFQANTALDKGQPNLVPEIFDGYQSLPLLYPDRDVFHRDEVCDFHEVWFGYSHAIDDLGLAEMHYAILKTIGSEDHDLEFLDEFIKQLRISRRLKIAENRFGLVSELQNSP